MSTLLIFAGYLILTIAVGLWASRKNRDSQEDFFLAGRELSAFQMALSAVSSGRSAWLVLGASGAAWLTGLSALWLFPGYIIAEVLMFLSIGPRLRQRSIEMGAITVPEVLSFAALGPTGRGTSRLPIRQLAGLVIVLFLLTYVSSQLVAGAKTLGAVFVEVDGKTWGLVITAGIILVYTWLGGYRAVVITDVVQACLMMIGILLLPVLGLIQLGGFGPMASQLKSIDPQLMALSDGWLSMIGGFCIGLGSFGNPHILVRHMSLKNSDQARNALYVGTFWNVVMAAGALMLGLVGRAIYPELAMLGEGGREALFPTFAQDMSDKFLFSGFVGFMLATLFAAIMSTCDSQLLVIASSLLRDLGPKSWRERKEGSLLLSRLAVLGTLIAAIWLTFGESPLVHNFVLLSWFALGIGLGPATIMLLYDRRTTALGVFCGILTGVFGVSGVWFFYLRPTGAHVSWEGGLVFLASLLVIWLFRSRDSAAHTH
ncbi:MAG: sodium/proline symporter [Planctomycetota bacterium]|jgi:sodium/proline symporter